MLSSLFTSVLISDTQQCAYKSGRQPLWILPFVLVDVSVQPSLCTFIDPRGIFSFQETFYVLNAFTLMDRKPKLLNPFLERTLVRLNAVSNNESPEYWNSYAYLLFYKALFLRHLGRLKEASNCFREIISMWVQTKVYVRRDCKV